MLGSADIDMSIVYEVAMTIKNLYTCSMVHA